MQQRFGCRTIIFLASIILFSVVNGWCEEDAPPAPEPEQELIIVKYGSLWVKSVKRGAKVYVDEIYKGSAGTVIESIIVGEHIISCKTDDKAVSGSFVVRKNETLYLEARFDQGKLARYKGPKKDEPEKKKPRRVRRERPRKPEPKAVEQKNPVEERRKVHLNVMQYNYAVTSVPDIKVGHKANRHVISKYSFTKNRTGKYYRTKQGGLLCDKGPCELNWTSSFIYKDEQGGTDAFLLKWKDTVFNGITPTGTSRRDLQCCLNGRCWKMEDKTESDDAREYAIGRYRLIWSKTSLLIRRSDIMKEVLDAGRSLTDY